MQETNVIEQGWASLGGNGFNRLTGCTHYDAVLLRQQAHPRGTGSHENTAATATHKRIPHISVVEKLIEVLGYRQITVVREEYAVSSDGMKMFGVMDLSSGFNGCRFAIGLRNSHDKSFRLSVGLKVFVCENLTSQRAGPRSSAES